MEFLTNKCSFSVLTEQTISDCLPFFCANDDLDEFFRIDAPLYSKQLLGKSYCFRLDDNPKEIVCAFTVSNDSIRVDTLPNSREKKVRRQIPYVKQMRRYPAVLIGRLGVNTKFASKGIGTELMNFIKDWFVDETNKTGCRFIVVDAYNDEKVLKYYKRNGFEYLFSSEEQEAELTLHPQGERLNTRLMYFDLINCI